MARKGNFVFEQRYLLYTVEMKPVPLDPSPGTIVPPYQRWVPVVFYLCSFVAAVSAAFVLRGFHSMQLGSLANLMGPLSENLAHGRGFVVCTDAMAAAGDVICSHASRMPLPPLFLAGSIRIFADHYLPVEMAKIALVLLPVAAAVALATERFRNESTASIRILVLALLFLSLVLPTQLIDVVNMQVEEGYSFCLLTYAVAVLLFAFRHRSLSWRSAILFALSILALYLTKSSMIAVAAFLVFLFCIQINDRWKRAAVLLLVACGPVGWGLYTLQATGRFSVGTSLDGINLHKGNYLQFLDRYPPAGDEGMDRYDSSLSEGKYFTNEWAFNAFHMHAAESYMRANPARTAYADWRKGWVFFLSIRKIGSEPYSGWLKVAADTGMVLFRLLLWAACAVALFALIRGPAAARWAAITYLGTVCAVAAPYVAGFALTRHAGVLVLPSALFLSWWILQISESHRV